MKSLSSPRTAFLALATLALSGLATASCEQPHAAKPAPAQGPALRDVVIAAPEGAARPPFTFSEADSAFLEQVQRGAFNYFWDSANPVSGMTPDRTSNSVVSLAGVGYQLASLCIGVDRGWVTRDQAEARTLKILRTLAANPANRKFGLFYHFVDGETAGQPKDAPEQVVSTIDTAIFFGGLITASEFFKGEVETIATGMLDAADWSKFVLESGDDPQARGFISLGWKPDDKLSPTGEGKLLPYAWVDCGDEHRLVTFLAVAATKPEHRVPPETYYKMRRQIGSYKDSGPMVWFPWSGSLFVAFFAHCWIDYASLGVDDPRAFKVDNRPRVDWWENSRRTAAMHRQKAIENPKKIAGLGPNVWGLTASDNKNGYQVPHLYPNPLPMPGAIPTIDYPVFSPKEDWGDGTVSAYGAGCTIMFDPGPAVAALRNYAEIKGPDGQPLLWRDPAKGGHGLRDSFNLGTGWVSPDDLAIDQGPLIVAIENARTGKLWNLFHAHPTAIRGLEALRLSRKPAQR